MSSEPAHDVPPLLCPEDYSHWRKSFLGNLTERLEQDAVFRLVGPLRSKRVLEVGCGDAAYSIPAAIQGAQVTAADTSARMLSSARRRAEESGAIVDWCEVSAERLPLKSNVFDAVLAVTALCFVEDPQQAVNEAARVLRPGGLLIIGEPGKFSWWPLWRTVRGCLGSARWRHARFWSSRQPRRLVVEAGSVLHSSRGVIYHPPIASIAKIMVGHEERMSVFGQIGAASAV